MFAPRTERAALQSCVALAGLVPVGAGLAGAILGAKLLSSSPVDSSVDSHMRYLSGLLFGIGVAFWAAIPSIEKQSPRFRLLTSFVVVGGLARVAGVAWMGWPGLPMRLALVMELIVTPALCLWQGRVERDFGLARHPPES